MNEGQTARQQIVEKIKGSSNILVTLSNSPSVDELSAAIGLTSMLNGMNKHATAVVSGDIPPAIEFLEPGKTFENTVDSLRDFIIALDKEKADHLRYKVDGDVVKIFITPYRTVINENDLDFSQGDYNVELVLALGVKDQDNLDAALSAHGKILHDATVATLSCGDGPSKLGQIDWFEPNASSISEMLVSISEALKGDKPVLDEQIATAFLTGIVASTDRFSNNKTSSKVMTMAAQLMAAGANQQLIAAKLEEAHEIGPDADDKDDTPSDTPSGNSDKPDNSDGTTDLSEGEASKVDRDEPKEEKVEEPKKDDDTAGQLAINHEKEGDLDEVAAQTAAENQASAAKTAEEELAEQLTKVAPAAAAKPSVSDLQKDLASASAEVEQAADQVAPGQPSDAVLPPVQAEPAPAPTPAPAPQADDKKILSHNGTTFGDTKPTFQVPFNATTSQSEEPKSVDIFQAANPTAKAAAPVEPAHADTLEDLDKKNRHADHEQARSDIELAYEATPLPTPPATQPPVSEPQPAPVVQEAVNEQLTPASPAPYTDPTQLPPPMPNGIDFSQLPPPPPLPDFTPQGPLPPEQLSQMFDAPAATPAPVPTPAPDPKDPGQFKIPGQ